MPAAVAFKLNVITDTTRPQKVEAVMGPDFLRLELLAVEADVQEPSYHLSVHRRR